MFKLAKKFISLICVLLIIFAATSAALTTSVSAAGNIVVQNFEDDVNYTYATSEVSETGFSLYTATGESDANVKDGTKSLKWQRASKGTCKITLWNSGKDLTVGTTYKMEMWVKAENAENTVISVTQLSTRSNAWTDTNNTSFQIGPFTSSSEWKKVELTFTATTQANGLFIYNGTAGSPATFYFDAITWTPVSEVTVKLEPNNGETLADVVGVSGTAMTLPAITKAGMDFAGWYTDAELTTPLADATVFPDVDTTLYAKWVTQGTVVQDFEANYTYATSEVSETGFSLYEAASENDANVKDGSKSLKWQRASKGTCKITLWNSGKDLTVGTTYKMEMWVKAENAENTVISVTQLSTRSNAWTDTNNTSFQIGPFTSSSEWKKVELTFTATTQANGLFIYNGTAGSPATFYFDAITWTPVSEVTVKLEPNNGETLADVVGVSGTAMTLPAITKEDMDFAGWYTDAELTTPLADATVFPDVDTTLYAKWVTQGTVVQDFEGSYTYATSEVSTSGFSLYEAASENDANVKDGSKSLKWQRANVGTCKITLWNSGKDLTVGTTYKMEMWVKSVKSDKSTISVTELSASSNGYSDTGNPSFSIGPFNSNGEWEKVELVFTATKQANGLFIYNGTADSGDTLYFDAITWTPVSEVTVKLEPNNGETLADVVGVSGTAMTLPAITKEDMDFAGWYTDAELTTPLADATVFPDVDTTLYAKWVTQGTVVQDFEANYTYATSEVSETGFSLYTATGKNDANVKDGSKSLKWQRASKGTCKITLWNSGKDLTVGTTYKMEMWVKSVKSDKSTISVTELSASSNGYSDTGNPSFSIGPFNSNGEWEKVELVFTATKQANGLFIFNGTADSGDTLYFDAITWTPVSEVTVKLEPNNGEILADVTGMPGAEMTLPTITKDGMEFVGWYIDAELTTPLEDVTVFPNADITLYAKWKSGLVTAYNSAAALRSADASSTGKNGLRIYNEIQLEWIETYDIVEFGCVAILTDTLNGEELNIETEKAGKGVAFSETTAPILWSVSETSYVYTAYLTNIPQKNYGNTYSIRTYAKSSEGKYYYGDVCEISVFDVLYAIDNGNSVTGSVSDADRNAFRAFTNGDVLNAYAAWCQDKGLSTGEIFDAILMEETVDESQITLKTLSLSDSNSVNAYIKQNGRTLADANGITMEWTNSGFSFAGVFEGDVTLNTSAITENHVYVIINDDYVNAERVIVSEGENVLTLASDLERAYYKITINKSTDTGSYYTATALNYTGVLDNKLPNKSLSIEFIGDSITSSTSLYTESEQPDPMLRDNSLLGFASLVSRDLNADLSVISRAGHAIVNHETGKSNRIMDWYKSTLYSNKDNAWNGTSDIVVVALGTNDTPAYLDDNKEYYDPNAELTNGIKSLLTEVRSVNPDAHIIFTYGMMDVRLANIYKDTVNEWKSENSDTNCYYLGLTRGDFCVGNGGHPNPEGHAYNANVILNFIKENIL